MKSDVLKLNEGFGESLKSQVLLAEEYCDKLHLRQWEAIKEKDSCLFYWSPDKYIKIKQEFLN